MEQVLLMQLLKSLAMFSFPDIADDTLPPLSLPVLWAVELAKSEAELQLLTGSTGSKLCYIKLLGLLK